MAARSRSERHRADAPGRRAVLPFDFSRLCGIGQLAIWMRSTHLKRLEAEAESATPCAANAKLTQAAEDFEQSL